MAFVQAFQRALPLFKQESSVNIVGTALSVFGRCLAEKAVLDSAQRNVRRECGLWSMLFRSFGSPVIQHVGAILCLPLFAPGRQKDLVSIACPEVSTVYRIKCSLCRNSPATCLQSLMASGYKKAQE